jgi:hypothetical protein
MTQAGMDVAGKTSVANTRIEAPPETSKAPAAITAGNELVLANTNGGTKRKFSLDEDEIDRNSRDDKAKARKAIEDEKVRTSPEINLWIPFVNVHVHRPRSLPSHLSGPLLSPPTYTIAYTDPEPRRPRRPRHALPPRTTIRTRFLCKS